MSDGQGRLISDPYYSQGRLFRGDVYIDNSIYVNGDVLGDDLLSDDAAWELLWDRPPGSDGPEWGPVASW